GAGGVVRLASGGPDAGVLVRGGAGHEQTDTVELVAGDGGEEVVLVVFADVALLDGDGVLAGVGPAAGFDLVPTGAGAGAGFGVDGVGGVEVAVAPVGVHEPAVEGVDGAAVEVGRAAAGPVGVLRVGDADALDGG